MPDTGPFQDLIFLTYGEMPSFETEGYEPWLREIDNPFFNSRPAIGLYENWRLERRLAGAGDFDYFDLLFRDPDHGLVDLWFDEKLTEFRQGWVAQWGYGAGAPAAVNGSGYRFHAPEGVHWPDCRRLLVVGDHRDAPPDSRARWITLPLAGRLPKHYAGQLAEGEPWEVPVDAGTPLGFSRLHLLAEPPKTVPAPEAAALVATAVRIAP